MQTETEKLQALIEKVNLLKQEIDWDQLFDASVVFFILETFEKIALVIKEIEKINPSFSGALIAELDKLFPKISMTKIFAKSGRLSLLGEHIK